MEEKVSNISDAYNICLTSKWDPWVPLACETDAVCIQHTRYQLPMEGVAQGLLGLTP